MKWLRHIGLIVAGGACIAASALIPPAACVLGPLGTKLLIAGGGAVALAFAEPLHKVVAAARGK